MRQEFLASVSPTVDPPPVASCGFSRPCLMTSLATHHDGMPLATRPGLLGESWGNDLGELAGLGRAVHYDKPHSSPIGRLANGAAPRAQEGLGRNEPLSARPTSPQVTCRQCRECSARSSGSRLWRAFGGFWRLLRVLPFLDVWGTPWRPHRTPRHETSPPVGEEKRIPGCYGEGIQTLLFPAHRAFSLVACSVLGMYIRQGKEGEREAWEEAWEETTSVEGLVQVKSKR